MANDTPKKAKPQSVAKLLASSLAAIKKCWLKIIIEILCVILITAIIFILLMIIWGSMLNLNLITKDNIIISRVIWQIISYLLFLFISAAAQFLVINTFLNPPLNLNANLKSMKNYYWQFLCLIFILQGLFVIFTLPIYLGIFLILMQNIILGIISLVFGYVLTILLAGYLFFSPYILIDQNTTCLQAIKGSFLLSQNNLLNIIFKLVILSLIIILINLAVFTLISLPYIGLLFSLLGIYLLVLITFSAIFSMYQDIKT